MSNRFLTAAEVAEDFRRISRKQVDEMPLETCREFAAIETVQPGINGAIVASLVMAARERIARMDYTEGS